jgi:peroxiredoxin family protein
MFNKMMKSKNVASLLELRQMAVDLGVKMYACEMSMDVMEMQREDMIDEVTDYVGAGFFIEQAQQADFTMFI